MMRSDRVVSRQFPRVPMDRRVGAFALDFGVASLLSVLLGGFLYIPVFLVLWCILRVIVVIKNQGQSLGQWAFDIKVINPRHRTVPGLTELVKREAITGFGSLLVLIGLVNLSPTNGWILVAHIPLLVDCSAAFTDPEYRQAFHDRVARTAMIQTRRGYSLDLKLKKIIDQASSRMRE